MENKFRALDIETTGLEAYDCQVVSWCIGPVCKTQDKDVDETKLIQNIAVNCSDVGLLTFMGETIYGPGFDFPFLRTRCAILGVPWPFSGVPHLAIMPIIQKRFDTKISFMPGVADLVVDDLKSMIKYLGIVTKAKNKQGYINVINELGVPEYIDEFLKGCKPVLKDINSLKGAYQLLTGEDPGDMRGDQVPILWAKYLKTHDTNILDTIRKYNIEDCRKTEVLWEIIEGCVPNRDLIPEIL